MSGQNTNQDFRIDGVRRATVNGQEVKIFSVWRKTKRSEFFLGQLSAPAKTPNRDLWKVVAKIGKGVQS